MGWSIAPILMDVLGAVLSILQLVIDSSLQNDWSGLTGNPVKLGLGNVSIIFDIVGLMIGWRSHSVDVRILMHASNNQIFLTQHYILYPSARKGEEKTLNREARGLLGSTDEEAAER